MMPTVMLTTHCPNACEWCFARPKMDDYRAQGIREMSWDDFVSVVDFYSRSGLRRMVLLGGEPGLHSRFTDILHLLGEKNFSVLVGTTGILPESLVDRIIDESFQQLDFALNSTSYFEYGKDQREQVDHFLLRMGRRVALSLAVVAKTPVNPDVDPARYLFYLKAKDCRRDQLLFAGRLMATLVAGEWNPSDLPGALSPLYYVFRPLHMAGRHSGPILRAMARK